MPTITDYGARRVGIGIFLVASGAALALSLGIATISLASSVKTTLVSVGSSGAHRGSAYPSTSADGRYVAFASNANPVTGVPSGSFVRDRKTARTRVVSSSGIQPSISADGRFVAFSDNADVFVYDLKGGKTKVVSRSRSGKPAGGASASPSVSGDGRLIAFSSYARTMTPHKPKAHRNEFVRDMKTGKTQQVNVSSSGKPGNSDSHHPSISANGRYVAFESNATNLVRGAKGWNIFVRDLKKHKTMLASLNSAGNEANGKCANAWMSGDGRYVAFESKATNLVKHDTNKSYDIFRRDLLKHKTVRVSISSSGKQGNGDSRYPSISNHGGFIAFYSDARDLAKGDTNGESDAFYRDVRTGKTLRVSVNSSGKQANGESSSYLGEPPSVSADGRFVAFDSFATNLVPGGINAALNIFLRGPLHG